MSFCGVVLKPFPVRPAEASAKCILSFWIKTLYKPFVFPSPKQEEHQNRCVGMLFVHRIHKGGPKGCTKESDPMDMRMVHLKQVNT